MKRWYDKNEYLSDFLIKIKDTDPKAQGKIVNKVISFIDNKDPEIRTKVVFEFSKIDQTYNRRWYDDYDKYPHAWLLFNMLFCINSSFLQSNVTSYIKEILQNFIIDNNEEKEIDV